MKTPEEILDDDFFTQNLDGVIRDAVIKAMKQYADYYMKESATFQSRKDILEEWLGELRDHLKNGSTIDNDAMVNEINELLNWEL